MKERNWIWLMIILCVIGISAITITNTITSILAADTPANAIPRKGDPVSVLYVQESDNTYSAIRNVKALPVALWADPTRWFYSTDFNYNVSRLSVTVKQALAATSYYMCEHSVACSQNATYGIYKTSESAANFIYGGKVVANGMGGQNTILPFDANTSLMLVVDLAAAGNVCINAQGISK